MPNDAPLSDRVEKAARGSRELDARIAQALGWKLVAQGYLEKPNWIDATGRLVGRQDDPYCPPRYTASLDAAMTLSLDEWSCGMMWDRDERTAHAAVGPNAHAGFPLGQASVSHLQRDVAFALALCAAALKARGGSGSV